MVATKESILEAIDQLMGQLQQDGQWSYIAALSRIKEALKVHACHQHNRCEDDEPTI